MSDQLSQFEHASLEADMGRLAAEIAKHRENPELKSSGERELLRQAIRSIGPIPAPAPSPATSEEPQGPLPDYAKSASPETKLEIEYLVDLALHTGIEKANSAARQSSPFVLDAFHDALAGKLYSELQKRGILK